MGIMGLNKKFSLGVFIGACLILTRPAFASTQPNVSMAEPLWQARSEATATWMWFDIYKATLLTKNTQMTKNRFNVSQLLEDEQPLKLKLCYLKSIEKTDLIKGAEAVLPAELSPDLNQAVNELHQAYENVKAGDCYALEYQPGNGTQLLLNDQLVFKTNLPGFKAVYFGIWLGENPLSDSLKTELLAPLKSKESPIL